MTRLEIRKGKAAAAHCKSINSEYAKAYLQGMGAEFCGHYAFLGHYAFDLEYGNQPPVIRIQK